MSTKHNCDPPRCKLQPALLSVQWPRGCPSNSLIFTCLTNTFPIIISVWCPWLVIRNIFVFPILKVQSVIVKYREAQGKVQTIIPGWLSFEHVERLWWAQGVNYPCLNPYYDAFALICIFCYSNINLYVWYLKIIYIRYIESTQNNVDVEW
jgi:hypothetical protein